MTEEKKNKYIIPAAIVGVIVLLGLVCYLNSTFDTMDKIEENLADNTSVGLKNGSEVENINITEEIINESHFVGPKNLSHKKIFVKEEVNESIATKVPEGEFYKVNDTELLVSVAVSYVNDMNATE